MCSLVLSNFFFAILICQITRRENLCLDIEIAILKGKKRDPTKALVCMLHSC